MEFEGRRVLVTGAGKGIGRSVVERLLAEGAEVIALSRTRSDLDQLEAEFGCQDDPVRSRRCRGRSRGRDRRAPGRPPRQQCRHDAARPLPRREGRDVRLADERQRHARR